MLLECSVKHQKFLKNKARLSLRIRIATVPVGICLPVPVRLLRLRLPKINLPLPVVETFHRGHGKVQMPPAQPRPRQEASSGPSRSSNNNPNMLQQTLEQTQRMIQASSSRGLFRRMNLNERLRASSNTPYPASRNRLNNKNIRNNRIYCNITQILPACFYKRVSYKKNPCISISKLLDRISAKVPLGLSW